MSYYLAHGRPLTSTFKRILFKYIEDKDVFQTFYTTKLSKRLFTVSQRPARPRISKLKEACGFEYTDKLQRMFTGMCSNSFPWPMAL